VPVLQRSVAQLMGGRAERPGERTDPPGLVELLNQVRTRVAPTARAHAEAFARELVGKAHVLLAEASDVEPLAGMVASAFAFLLHRGGAPMALRVFAPQAQRDGWSSPLAVVESVVDDRPFIVDTLCEAIAAQGGEIRVLLHPVLGVGRTDDGSIRHVGGAEGGPGRESFFHAEVANLAPSVALQQQLADRLRQIILATDDYKTMRERVGAIANELRAQPAPLPAWGGERDEVAAFLEWLSEKSFVYLGYREYDLRGMPGTREAIVRPGRGLGLLRDDARSRYGAARAVAPELARRLDQPPLWLVSKTHAVSPIHRAAPMDDISIKEVDGAGTVVGVRRLLGLFTAKGYADAPSEMPILRRRIATLLAREGAVDDSHDYRDLLTAFNSLPREYLLASELADIHQLVNTIRAADAHIGMRLVCRPDALWRGLLITVLVPRARFSTELHGHVAAAVRRHLRARVLHAHLALDDRPVARLHYYCAAPLDVLERPPLEALQVELDSLLRTWDDELRDVLARTGARPDVG
jgi:glutamate dehydrogenase